MDVKEKQEKEELEKEAWKELKDQFSITPRFKTMEEFNEFFDDPNSVLKL